MVIAVRCVVLDNVVRIACISRCYTCNDFSYSLMTQDTWRTWNQNILQPSTWIYQAWYWVCTENWLVLLSKTFFASWRMISNTNVHHLILHIECKTNSDSISTNTVVLGLQWSVQIPCFLFIISIMKTSHERQAVSNYQSSDCLFNSLWGPTSTKHHSPHYWPFVRGIHWSPVNFPHKESVTWKKFPYDDIIMNLGQITPSHHFTEDYWAQNSAFCLTHWPLGDFKEVLGK